MLRLYSISVLPGLLLIIMFMTTSCQTFRQTEYIPESRSFNNYIANYSLIVPTGFELIEKRDLPKSLSNLWRSQYVFKNTEKNAFIGIYRTPINAMDYKFWKTMRDSVDGAGISEEFSRGFARLFKRDHGTFLNSFEDFMIFHRNPKFSDFSIDQYDAITTYNVSRGSYEYSIFVVSMVCPTYPASLLDFRKFLYNIHLYAFTNDERVVRK